tara:strand:+ start:1085 stop:1552 length:468 start_codon:yes stop_codon:yes gene_type:complete
MTCDIMPYKRKRILITVSIGLFVTPIAWKSANNLIGFGLMYFLGMYFILFNFPEIGIFLSSKPHYIEDLDNENYKLCFIGLQNLFLSILFGVLVDSLIINMDNKSLIELFGLIGGNLALFIRFQSLIGKILLIILTYYNERYKRRLSIDEGVSEV